MFVARGKWGTNATPGIKCDDEPRPRNEKDWKSKPVADGTDWNKKIELIIIVIVNNQLQEI